MKGGENMIEKYIGLEDKKTYWVVPVIGHSMEDAKKEANKHFKTSIKKLKAKCWFVYQDKLYKKKICTGAVPVIAVWKE